MYQNSDRREDATPPGGRRRNSKSYRASSPKTNQPKPRSPALSSNKLLGNLVQEELTVPLSPKKVRSNVDLTIPDLSRDKVPQRQRPPSSEADPTDLKQKLKKMERREALAKEGSPAEGVLSPRKKGKVTSPRSRLKENQVKERPQIDPRRPSIGSSSGNVWTVKAEAHELTKKDLDELNPALLEVVALPGNDVCADCNRKKPSWCSLSLGVLLCVKCSSVHRSFGSQHTIRSLVLDSWHTEDIQRVRSFGGNTKLNSQRETSVDLSKKPTWDSSEEDRKNWIRLKYPVATFSITEILRPPSSPPSSLASSSASSPTSIHLETICGHLNLNLFGGRNLVIPDGKTEINPYCTFKVGKQEIRSTIVKNSLSPYWGEVLRLPIINKKDLLHVVVKSSGPIQGLGVSGSGIGGVHHDFLGSATVSLEELIDAKPSVVWVRLENVKHGLLHIELTFNAEKGSPPRKSD